MNDTMKILIKNLEESSLLIKVVRKEVEKYAKEPMS